jgi:hypothetical protein
MLAGVEILLERMKTNPEEFVEGEVSKWSRVMDTAWSVLTEAERDSLQGALIEAKRDHFTGEVMRVLSGDVEEEPTVEERYHKHKRLMQGSAIIPSQTMMNQTTQILRDEFDKAYAAQNTTSNPYQQRK